LTRRSNLKAEFVVLPIKSGNDAVGDDTLRKNKLDSGGEAHLGGIYIRLRPGRQLARQIDLISPTIFTPF